MFWSLYVAVVLKITFKYCNKTHELVVPGGEPGIVMMMDAAVTRELYVCTAWEWLLAAAAK